MAFIGADCPVPLQCRAVKCGFVLAESRGPVGRLFRDFGGDSTSLREALLNPRFTANLNDTTFIHTSSTRVRDGSEMTAKREAWDAKFQPSSSTAKHAHWPAEIQQRNAKDAAVALAGASDRRLQHHVCFQALHVFNQEHGHLPLPSKRDHAEEVVRIAEELVEMERNASVIAWVAPVATSRRGRCARDD